MYVLNVIKNCCRRFNDLINKKERKYNSLLFKSLCFLVDCGGLEPPTLRLRVECSTNWASSPYKILSCSVAQLLEQVIGFPKNFSIFRVFYRSKNIVFTWLWLKTCHRQLFFTRRPNWASSPNEINLNIKIVYSNCFLSIQYILIFVNEFLTV